MARYPVFTLACILTIGVWGLSRAAAPCKAADAPVSQGTERTKLAELLSQTPDIPDRVVYKKADPEVNRQALEMLSSRSLLSGERTATSKQLFSDMLICGPGLWRNIKNDADMKTITKGEVKLRIPTKDGEQEMAGKLFQNADEVAAFWKAFKRFYKIEEAHVRRPTKEELQIYWAMISFDIEEPLFIVESKSAVILVQFARSKTDKTVEATELKIFWIDDYKDVHLKGEGPMQDKTSQSPTRPDAKGDSAGKCPK